MAVGFPTKSNWSAGDVLTASGMDDLAGTLNYLSPVGQANGSTLVANSANASGLGWTSGNPIPNPVINSCFDIWQRNTSISLAASTAYTSGFTADRWQTKTGANQATTISRQATGDTTNLPNIQYCARFQRNSGQTGTTAYDFLQNVETSNTVPFAGKTVTLSFYARAGANFSSTSNTLSVLLLTGTGTDQNAFASFTGSATPIASSATLTTTWQRFTFTGTIGATVSEMAVDLGYTPTGTAGTNDYFEITGVQLDVGSVALPVRRNATTLQGELAACERYGIELNPNGNAYASLGSGYATSGTAFYPTIPLPVPLRTTPTSVTASAAGNWRVFNNLAVPTVTGFAINAGGCGSNTVSLAVTVSTGLTSGSFYALEANNNTAARLFISAEL